MSSLYPEVIETERLRLERFSRDTVDALEYYEICSSDPGIEEVTEYLPWEPHDTPKETWALLERKERQWDGGEKAPYVIRPREGQDGAGEIAGQTGIQTVWDQRTATMNIWLRERFWGRGYSGERAAAMFELAFARLDLDAVSVLHLVGNENSRRAIEEYIDRFGGRRDGLLRNAIVVDGDPRDEYRYTVTREEWVANRPGDLEVQFHD